MLGRLLRNGRSSSGNGRMLPVEDDEDPAAHIIHVDDNKPQATAEPIFDEVPALYILYPHAKNPGSTAPKTTKLTGKFLITLNEPMHILSMVARLIPCYSVKFRKIKESGSRPPVLCQIMQGPIQLAKGDYELPFCFELPCDSFGRSISVTRDGLGDEDPSLNVWYTFAVNMTRFPEQAQASSSTAAVQPETLVVHFPTKKDLSVMIRSSDEWKQRYNRRFFALVSSPVDPGELPPPLEKAVEEFAPQLGPINLIVTSRSLTVGALINFNVSLPALPRSSALNEIKAHLDVDGGWTSPSPTGPCFNIPTYRYNLFTIDGDGLQKEYPLDEPMTCVLSAHATARLPNDQYMSHSTLPGVRSPTFIRNTLVFEFSVIDEQAKWHKVNIRMPVVIASCFLIPEYIHLPSYGSEAVPKAALQPERPTQPFFCACGFSFDQLIQRENEGVPLVEAYEPPYIKSQLERYGEDAASVT